MAGKIRKSFWLYRPWKWLTLLPDLRAIKSDPRVFAVMLGFRETEWSAMVGS